MKQVLPRGARVAILFNTTSLINARYLKAIQESAGSPSCVPATAPAKRPSLSTTPRAWSRRIETTQVEAEIRPAQLTQAVGFYEAKVLDGAELRRNTGACLRKFCEVSTWDCPVWFDGR